MHKNEVPQLYLIIYYEEHRYNTLAYIVIFARRHENIATLFMHDTDASCARS